jgi:4-hydroxybenzoate polyprenyltransferase
MNKIKLRYHILFLYLFIFSSFIVVDGWNFSNTAFFIALLYFCSYLTVYGIEIVKYISDKENKNNE